MPQKRTSRPGAITSFSRLPAAEAQSSLLGRTEDVAARFFIRLQLDEASLFGLLEKIREGLEAVIGFVETRMAPLQCLLHHRAPDFLVRAPLGDERLQRSQHEVEALLLLVLRGGSGLAPLLGGA